MELIDHFRRQFRYDQWANRKVLAALPASPDAARSVRLLAHILGAECIWLDRLKQQPQRLPVWPQFDLAECAQESERIHGEWDAYLDVLTAANLSHAISYKNSKGESWSSNVEDVLTHVITHSAYHRGQIALEMRQAGQTPAYTDFIHGVRQGQVR